MIKAAFAFFSLYAPKTTWLSAEVFTLLPIATEFSKLVLDSVPPAIEKFPPALVFLPIANAFSPLALHTVG